MANIDWSAIPENQRPKRPTEHEKRVQLMEEAKKIGELNHQYRMKLLDKIEAGTFSEEDRKIFDLLDKNCLIITKLVINM